MIVLDTHIWVWWVDGSARLTPAHEATILAEVLDGLGVSAISCWEVAKLVESGRLRLAIPVEQWLNLALRPPVRLLPLSPEVAIESTRLPGTFHRDPADQMIVATARRYGVPLLTADRLILAYAHVRLAP